MTDILGYPYSFRIWVFWCLDIHKSIFNILSTKLGEISYSKYNLGNSIFFFIYLIADVFANQAVEEIKVFCDFIESDFGCQQAVF